MSGIGGIVWFNGRAADRADLERMGARLARRGPERTGYALDGGVGLTHTLLATTPEAALEQLPLTHSASGCSITADVRLDNRHELAAALGLPSRAPDIGDAELVLRAYLRWGTACVQRLLGDFAFGIWDTRIAQLFCARDRFGMRPLYYHHHTDGAVVFASEARAVLAVACVPKRISESRVADFLVSELEGIDNTQTFFEGVLRLPPAHTLVATAATVRVERYWSLTPAPPLRLANDDAYAEAFLSLFTDAVRSRLRTHRPVGSMLSGGMDSGSVVSVAQSLLRDAGMQQLRTFSGTSPLGDECVETRAIFASMSLPGLRTHQINHGQLGDLLAPLTAMALNADEPFDSTMTLPRAMYLAANREGVNVVLDGVAGDLALSPSSYLPRLIRSGHWIRVVREAVGERRYWGGDVPSWKILYQYSRAAAGTPAVRRLRGTLWGQEHSSERARRAIADSAIAPALAERVQLPERLKRLDEWRAGGAPSSYGMDCAAILNHPYLTVARERYDRAAASVAVEPRDPFLDLRLLEFCVALPGSQRVRNGWPKFILRHAMRGRLPEAVLWRRGKEHLGWAFTASVSELGSEVFRQAIVENRELLAPFVREEYLSGMPRPGDVASRLRFYEIAVLGSWLRRWSEGVR